MKKNWIERNGYGKHTVMVGWTMLADRINNVICDNDIKGKVTSGTLGLGNLLIEFDSDSKDGCFNLIHISQALKEDREVPFTFALTDYEKFDGEETYFDIAEMADDISKTVFNFDLAVLEVNEKITFGVDESGKTKIKEIDLVDF